MVHPPQKPAQVWVWDWILSVQVMAAMVLANLDDGWEGSSRREALEALVKGPMDWTVVAGLVALEQIAHETAATAPSIIELFRHVYDHRPDFGYVPYSKALVECGLRLPDLPDDFREALQQSRD